MRGLRIRQSHLPWQVGGVQGIISLINNNVWRERGRGECIYTFMKWSKQINPWLLPILLVSALSWEPLAFISMSKWLARVFTYSNIPAHLAPWSAGLVFSTCHSEDSSANSPRSHQTPHKSVYLCLLPTKCLLIR
jgi:hypothetical protein